MDGFSYNNIFETKGIEYLIIIAFLLMIIPFWIIINREASDKKPDQKCNWDSFCGYFKNSAGTFFQQKSYLGSS